MLTFVPLTDLTLLRRAREGDKAALAALVERHYPALLASCRRMLHDADLAHDAAQEAVLRAMLGLGQLRNDERFGAWLVGIGLNVCRTLLSASRGRPTSSLDALRQERSLAEPAGLRLTPLERVEAQELATAVRAAITKLPAGQREAVALFYLAGLTHSEIADELGTRRGAIKTRLHKARKALRAPLFDLYQEHIAMTDKPTNLIPMEIAELRRTAPADPARARHIVFLRERDGERRLPIWIGPGEASALAVILDDVRLPRPGVYQFAAALLTAAGGQLREVHITDLTDSTFYAQALLDHGASVDARPSDALTLALITGAPIFVTPGVLEQAAHHEGALRALVDEAEQAPHDARTIADDVRTRIAASAAELAELRRHTP